jgi:hypothetical protein
VWVLNPNVVCSLGSGIDFLIFWITRFLLFLGWYSFVENFNSVKLDKFYVPDLSVGLFGLLANNMKINGGRILKAFQVHFSVGKMISSIKALSYISNVTCCFTKSSTGNCLVIWWRQSIYVEFIFLLEMQG